MKRQESLISLVKSENQLIEGEGNEKVSKVSHLW